MKEESTGLIIGISIGVVIGVVLAISALICFRYHRKRSQIGNSSSRRAATIPIRANGADSCTILSDSTLGPESPVRSGSRNGMNFWIDGFKKSNMVSASGILEYSYKYGFFHVLSCFKFFCIYSLRSHIFIESLMYVVHIMDQIQ
jgi:vacuolar-type H+-ATPase subunit I/STV1